MSDKLLNCPFCGSEPAIETPLAKEEKPIKKIADKSLIETIRSAVLPAMPYPDATDYSYSAGMYRATVNCMEQIRLYESAKQPKVKAIEPIDIDNPYWTAISEKINELVAAVNEMKGVGKSGAGNV